MCGLSGAFSINYTNLDTGIVEQMAGTCNHRGPDNTGFYKNVDITFGHNRLSLLDLSEHGNQPWSNERYILIYNGELYNFKQLKEILQNEVNIVYKSESDTEVLFNWLVYKGIEKTLNAIEGMFAFAFYDTVEKTLILARDRVGIKPLFYYNKNTILYFASEIKALVQVLKPVAKKDIVLESVFGYLESSRINTAFQDILQLEPGTWLTIKKEGRPVIQTYFKSSDLVNQSYYNELQKMPTEKVISVFDDLMNKSVNKMLISDASVGAFVSGGVDSSLISAICKKYNKNINLYTANVMGKFSEYEDAKAVSKYLGLPLFTYNFEPEMFIKEWVKVTYNYESPLVVHTNAVPFHGIANVASLNKEKAVLTGEGSDELFLGYPALLTKRLDWVIRMPYNILNKFYKGVPGLSKYLNLDKVNYRNNLAQQIQGFEREIKTEEYQNAYSFINNTDIRNDHIQTLKMLDSHLHTLLWRNDRIGMMHSIESRFPFLDEDILKFAASLPMEYKIRRINKFHNYKHMFMMDKYIVRKLAVNYLPEKVANRAKVGFPMFGLPYVKPKKDFFKNSYWQELMGLNEKQVEYMLANTPQYLLGKIMSVDIWGRLFIQQQTVMEVENHVFNNTEFTGKSVKKQFAISA